MVKSTDVDRTRERGGGAPPRRALFCLIALACLQGRCLGEEHATVIRQAPLATSLRLEMEAAITHGAYFLSGSQDARGSWGKNPCVTAMAVMACANASRSDRQAPFEPMPKRGVPSPSSSPPDTLSPIQQLNRQKAAERENTIQRGLDYVISCLRRDGSIANETTAQYSVLSTAICLQAIASHPETGTRAAARRASLAYLIRNQADDGGFSPGRGGNSHLGTTLYVMEALYLSALNTPFDDAGISAALDKAGTHISRQNNRDHSTPPPSPPGMSFGPASHAAAIVRGLVYAGAGPGSAELRHALTQLDKAFSVTENPGLGQRGYYTYLLGALKTLRVCEQIGVDLSVYPRLKNWRNESARELMKRQTGFGRWRQGESDWRENNPDIVTANVMFALVNILL
ncbi:MAG: prenyltransferase/squalene oxidase repeat-containing protein [Lentisphaeria bacterium]|nr:prenyltransferase/squalene oxidase repeat-containing protein [Lentisphaeria bacterium]